MKTDEWRIRIKKREGEFGGFGDGSVGDGRFDDDEYQN